ncbi:MFS transporter [Micromonospora sp. KC213]|uniref:MFS transporter n=1 Tax=Micromonospora sp. KC213 TaxID=2530378 RepID=UPI001043E2FC|nr:MFS transporter [Micromonospora sp. KC213]TDC42689.1 MFS transporter [Micromonospora sp. KC213]
MTAPSPPQGRASLAPGRGTIATIGWSLAARLHLAATTIAVTLLVTDWGYSYGQAGMVLAGLTVGQGIAGPVNGRLVDRWPQHVALGFTVVAYSGGLVALSLLPGPLRATAPALALLVGLANPPVTQTGRKILARLAHGRELERLYRLDATGQELIFVIAPPLVALVGAASGGRAAVWTLAGLALGGGLGFAVRLRRLAAGSDGTVPTDDDADGTGRHRPAALLAVVAAMGCVMVAITAVDLALLAWARDRGSLALAGWFAATWAVGSLVGGAVSTLAPGRLASGPVRRLFWFASGLVILLPALLVGEGRGAAGPVLVCLALAIGGTAIAPALAVLYHAVVRASIPRRRGEAFGWFATGVTVGAGVGAPLTGAVYDLGGVRPALVVAVAAGYAAVLLMLPVRHGDQTAPDDGVPVDAVPGGPSAAGS